MYVFWLNFVTNTCLFVHSYMQCWREPSSAGATVVKITIFNFTSEATKKKKLRIISEATNKQYQHWTSY